MLPPKYMINTKKISRSVNHLTHIYLENFISKNNIFTNKNEFRNRTHQRKLRK